MSFTNPLIIKIIRITHVNGLRAISFIISYLLTMSNKGNSKPLNSARYLSVWADTAPCFLMWIKPNRLPKQTKKHNGSISPANIWSEITPERWMRAHLSKRGLVCKRKGMEVTKNVANLYFLLLELSRAHVATSATRRDQASF